MVKLKYIAIVILTLFVGIKAEALDINYSTIIGKDSKNILVEYYGLGDKENYVCNVKTLSCSKTKKTYLTKPVKSTIKKSLKSELGSNHANHITFSPTKKYVAYYISRNDSNNKRTYVVKNIKTNTDYKLENDINYWDLVADQGKIFSFSPNEKSMVYTNDFDGAFALYLVDTTKLGNGMLTSKKLATSAFEIDDFIFADNQTIYYIGNSSDNNYVWNLYKYDLKTGKDKIIDTYVSYTDSLVKVGNNIIYNHLAENGYSPKKYNIDSKKVSQFKTPFTNKNLIIKDQEVVKFNSLNGVLMKPSTTLSSYPLVIWLHGGPYRQTSYGYHPYHSYGIYDSILELLRKNNVLVLKLDYRGSLGFGRAYSEGIKNNVGKGDVEDVMNAINYAKSRYNIDNVYLMGNSYGGYMSLRALAEHPGAFTGVVSINGVTDWEALLAKMETSIFNTDFGGLPNINNRALYDQASITSRIGNIGNQKIDIIAGMADRTIPYWQATTMYDLLKSQGKNVNLVSYPGEDHVYKEKKTISSLCVELFNFVGKEASPECNN